MKMEMTTHTSLSDGCTAGVFGGQHTWARTLEASRRGIEDHHDSAAEAGTLGVLLLPAGQGERALEVFARLDHVVPGPPGRGRLIGRTTSDTGYKVYPVDGSGVSGASGPRDEDREPHLLAALVLSGQWAQAHRCC